MNPLDTIAGKLYDLGIKNFLAKKEKSDVINILREFDNEFDGTVIDNLSFYKFLLDDRNINQLFEIIYHEDNINIDKFNYFIDDHYYNVRSELSKNNIYIPDAILKLKLKDYYEKLVNRLKREQYSVLENEVKKERKLDNLYEIVDSDVITIESLNINKIDNFFNTIVKEDSKEVYEVQMLVSELMTNSFSHGKANSARLCVVNKKILLSDDGRPFNFIKQLKNKNLMDLRTGGEIHLHRVLNSDISLEYYFIDNQNFYIFEFPDNNIFVVNNLCELCLAHGDSKIRQNSIYNINKIKAPDKCEIVTVFVPLGFSYTSYFISVMCSLFISIKNSKGQNNIKKLILDIDTYSSISFYQHLLNLVYDNVGRPDFEIEIKIKKI